MSLSDIAGVADDLTLRARDLVPLLNEALGVCAAGSPVMERLVALKCSLTGIEQEGLRLRLLTRRDLAGEALPGVVRTPSAEELEMAEALGREPLRADGKMAAANDHSLLDS